MNDWDMDAFEWLEAETALTQAFYFIFDTLQQLFSAIFKNWLFFVPLFLFLLLSMMYFVGWVIMESSQYAGGSPFANPNRQFGRMANPNRQYETNMPLWSSILKNSMRKYVKNQNQKEQDFEREKAMYEKLQKKSLDESLKRQEIERNQLKATEYFKHNPHAFKINIDGHTFWRDGWESTDWHHVEDETVRISQQYEKVGDKYKLVKEKYYQTKFDDSPKFTGGFVSGENRSFDLDDALSKALAHSKNKARQSVDVQVDEDV